jgi:hypothetical protein
LAAEDCAVAHPAAAVLVDEFDAGSLSLSLADLPEKRDQERQV